MKYAQLVSLYQQLASTTKSLEKQALLADFIRAIPEDELKNTIYLLQGNVFPEWEEKKIGFSSRLILKAIIKATGIPQKRVEELWNKWGDLGIVAAELIQKKTQTTLFSTGLTTQKVITNLRKLAELEGQGTVERKVSVVTELLTSATPEEAKFVVKTVLQELRVGIAEGIIGGAIAQAFNQEVKSVEHAYHLTADYGEVALLARQKKVGSVSMTPGKPIRSMLAILARSAQEALEALGTPVQCEYKLDGFRLQIHKKGKDITLFTRRLENVTAQFPDVVEVVKENVTADTCILDAEAVAISLKTGKYLPFQNISQRIKRKYNIAEVSKKFPVEVNLFDVLYLEGEQVIEKPQKERRKLLEKIVKEKKNCIRTTPLLIASTQKEAQAFFKESLKKGSEGIMLKKSDAPYRSGRYVGGWMKLKQVLEPLDLVIVGAEHGTGKRAGMLTSYVIACRNGDTFLPCGMVSTGLKEKEEEGTTFRQISELITPFIISREGRTVRIKPEIVIEVGYEEIQKSPTYASGYALRFPRFLRLRTMEKEKEEANTIADLEKMYSIQKKR